MCGKNRIGFWIFTLGVLVLLLRPYMVYQMVSGDQYKMNPARTWNLLQRLVKKKDDHHDEHSTDVFAVLNNNTTVRPQLKLLISLFVFLVSLFKLFVVPVEHMTVQFQLIQRQRYRLSSCLLI